MGRPNCSRAFAVPAFRDGVFARTNDNPTELDASNVEDVHGNLEALAAFVEEVFDGHLNVVEEELAGARPFDAHLLLFRIHCDAVVAFFENEGTQVFVVVNLGKHNHHIGKSAVGDPHFLAVEHIVRASLVQLGRRLAAVGVRPASRFCEAVASFELARRQARDVLLFLGVVPVVQDGQRADARVGGEADGEAVCAAHAFRDEHGALKVQTKSVQLLRHRASEQSEFPDLFEEFGCQSFFKSFDAFEVGDDALGHKVEAGLEHHAVFFGPLFRREDFICAHVTDEEFAASDGLGGRGVSSGHVVEG